MAIYSQSQKVVSYVFAPEGKRALKNTGKGELLMLCIQYKANSFVESDSPASDGNILNEPLKW